MMDQITFENIIKSQSKFADLWRKQQHEKKIAHNLKMSIARAEKRLLNPLKNPYKKTYFTKNAFEEKFTTKT